MNTARVIVVGAGSSGIAAASRLLENGLTDIIVLEAEDRIGGRIKTVDFDDGVIDLGGQWVAGEKGNAVFALAHPLNLLAKSITTFLDKSTSYVTSSGKIFQMNEAPQLFEILIGIVQDSKSDFKTYKGTVGDYFVSEFQKRLKEKNVPLEDYSLANGILDWYEKLDRSNHAADPWFETSAYGYSQSEDCEGQFWNWKSGGYRTILDVLMKKYPDKSKQLPVLSKVLLKKEVEKITWDHLQNERVNKVVVDCSDGTTYVADFVLVTISLGVLKERAKSLFCPPLTEEKLITIKGLGFGPISKIFIKFPYQWWPLDNNGFNFVWTKEDKENLITRNKNESRDKTWLQELCGFYEVDNHPSVLQTWCLGSCVQYIELLSENEVIEDLMELLNRFLGKKYNIPQPVGLARSQWASNHHFRGSASHRNLQTEEMGASASLLAKPMANSLGKEVLLFGGEATHDSYYGSVHGAIESGWREGDRLLKLCG